MTRGKRPRVGLLVIAWLGLGANLTSAQPGTTREPPTGPAPLLVGLSPLGITAGTTSEWTVTGRNLGGVERFLISGEGVTIIDRKLKPGNAFALIVRAEAGAEPGLREVRAESPDGLSNFLLFRVETIPIVQEREPNDDPAHATEIGFGSAVAGTLEPRDLDHFRFSGRAGQRVTVEVEAHRLGSPVLPVVTLLSSTGIALAQGRETRGDRDGRLSYRLPRDGTYLLLVHDFLFGGDDSAGYRLRISDAPFATGLFPLGGRRGRPITVTASGGSLAEPRAKTVTLPDEPGAVVEPGPFDGPGGPVSVPQRLAVGEGPEVFEAQDSTETRLAIGMTANGRISRPGEVDRYIILVKAGDRLRFEVQAAALGSWLDSVLVVRDAQGNELAENDDPGNPNAPPRAGLFGIASKTPDSLIDFEAKADGELHVEITDRFGDGGPEYAYRLTIVATSPAFAIKLLLANPNASQYVFGDERPAFVTGPGSLGALNLKPGEGVTINFLVTPEGRPGRITLRAEGLPPGVTAEPVTVVLSRLPGARNPLPQGGSLNLKVATNAEPALGSLRVVATTRLPDGSTLTRKATTSLTIGTVAADTNRPVAVREVTEIPIKIVGRPRPKSSGPVVLRGITVPGVLLQGTRLDLALETQPPDARADRFHLQAEVEGPGLVADTAVRGSAAASEIEPIVRVVAAVDAEPGVHPVRLRFEPTGGPAVEREVAVIVRTPIRVHARPDPIALPPGASARIVVGIGREPGYDGPVELRVEGLPEGVRVSERSVVPKGEAVGTVRLVRDATAPPIAREVAVRVVGVARMPGGPVSVNSAIRPTVRETLAEESGREPPE